MEPRLCHHGNSVFFATKVEKPKKSKNFFVTEHIFLLQCTLKVFKGDSKIIIPNLNPRLCPNHRYTLTYDNVNHCKHKQIYLENKQFTYYLEITT